MNHQQASVLEYEEVAKTLETDLTKGLTSFEARERLKRYGQNRLDDELISKTVPRFVYLGLVKYLSQFTNPLIQLLLLCVVISLSIGEYENAASVLVAILLVCTISYVQEYRADKSLEKLNNQMPMTCKVIRENQAHELEANLIVPGDIIHLSEGQRVPADLRLFNTLSLTVNEANLTGETQSQLKNHEPTSRKLASMLDGEPTPQEDPYYIFQNLALMGTIVESGHTKGIVISTGRSTRYGEVYCILKNTVQPRGPLQVNMDKLSIQLVVISCSLIAFVSIMGIIQQRPIMEIAYYATSLAVTAIPEGLPVVVAVIMALGVLRLSKERTVVKSLNSIETLGCIEILCADKTGTLTRHDMTLTDVVTSELHSLSSAELQEMNNEECRKQMTFNKFGGKMYSIGRLIEVGTLCNNASFDPEPPGGAGAPKFIGQATECAILDAAMRMGYGDSRTKYDRIKEIPFCSNSRQMAVQCKRRDLPGTSPMYYVKGAWEVVLEDCKYYYECGLVKPRTEEMWTEYTRICTALGSQGLRVLALATGTSTDELAFVGVVGINNSLRDGIIETLDRLRDSFHIEIKMITGDCRATAVAVGRSLGMIGEDTDEDRQIMSGEQIDKLLKSEMDPLAMAHEICSKTVFYRVSPIQKADIVGKIQEVDKMVAMTGDGVNDVISLKRANLSLVMGAGADVCKEVADVILADDDLSVLIPAVIEGKGIYRKLQSFMTYQISVSLSLVVLVGISYAFRVTSPFTVIQLLFINLLTDGPPAQSLGVEKIDVRDLNPLPRDVHAPIINCGLMRTILALTLVIVSVNGLIFYILVHDGFLDGHDRCILFTCFVFCTMFATISLRSKRRTIFEIKLLGNKELLCVNIFVVLIQVAIINTRFLNKWFEIEPISSLELIYVFLCAASVLVIMESIKIIARLLDYMKRFLLKEKPSETSKERKDMIKDFP